MKGYTVNDQKTKPVTFRFKNIGPVKNAELELGELTIIAGRNNTGKTYLVYTLYSFLHTLLSGHNADYILHTARQSSANFPDIGWITEKAFATGNSNFPLHREKFQRHQRILVNEIAREFSDNSLSSAFNAQQSEFNGASIEVEFNDTPFNDSFCASQVIDGEDYLSIDYNGTNFGVSVDVTKCPKGIGDVESDIAQHYIWLLIDDLFPEPFILSAERFGISLFHKELDFAKNKLVDFLQQFSVSKNREKGSLFRMIDKSRNRYALPINDSIDYTRDIPNLMKTRSEIFESKLFDDIKDIMDGYYESSDDDIRFISKARKAGKFNIPLHLASSSARGLADLYFYLKHLAKTNDLLIVEEPESFLDTVNQIRLARLLAKCVRTGVQVLITTHSDYLIKEINNLVMLSRPFEDKKAVVKKLKYSPDDFIAPDSIRAYIAEDNTLTRCEVDKFGIDMPVFDETIDRINAVANNLASRMSEE